MITKAIKYLNKLKQLESIKVLQKVKLESINRNTTSCNTFMLESKHCTSKESTD